VAENVCGESREPEYNVRSMTLWWCWSRWNEWEKAKREDSCHCLWFSWGGGMELEGSC